LPRPLAALTLTPRRYGFHGTLKPPFRLPQDVEPATLDRALNELAERLAPVTAPGLTPSTGLGFLALTPGGPAPALGTLAAACIRDLDRFRAPPGTAELAQRRARVLSLSQEENLIRWGYPYVLGDFRFHLTLSGHLQPGEAQALIQTVIPLAAPHLDPVLHVGEICLYGDPGAGAAFRLIRRYPLTG
jgi:hypothetical protein